MRAEAPPVLRVLSNILMLFGVVSFLLSFGAFAVLPWWLASLAVLYPLAQFVSFVGLRRMRRWSVYVFLTCVAVGLAGVVWVGIAEFAASPQRIVFALLPIILFFVAWYPNRALFS
jgi:hypothetical protein